MTDNTDQATTSLDAATRAMPAAVYVAALFLMLHHTYILPVRIPLSFLRWVPLAAMAGYGGMVMWLDRTRLRRFYWFDLVALAFIAFAVSSAVYSIDPSLTVAKAESLALVYVGLFWGLWVAVDRVGTGPVINAFVNAGTAVFVLLYLTLPWQNIAFATNGIRLRSFLENSNTVGLMVAFLLPLVLLKALQSRQSVWYSLTLLLLASLIFSQSRTGLGATLLGGSYLMYHALPARRRLVAVGIAAYCAVYVGWSQVAFVNPASLPGAPLGVTLLAQEKASPPAQPQQEPAVRPTKPAVPDVRSVWERLFDWSGNPRLRDLVTLGGRLDIWRAGVRFWRICPVLGYGYGTEERIMKVYNFNEMSYGSVFHSSFLGLTLQVGPIWMLVLWGPVLALAWREWRGRGVYAEMPERFALRALMFTGIVTACFESSLNAMGSAFAFVFWTSVMLLARMSLMYPMSTPSSRIGFRARIEDGRIRLEFGRLASTGKPLEAPIVAR